MSSVEVFSLGCNAVCIQELGVAPFVCVYDTGLQGPPGPSGGGGGGGELTDEGTWSSPHTISDDITFGNDTRTRVFLVGDGAVVNPDIKNGGSKQELFLVGTSDTNTIEFNSVANLLTNGPIVLRLGSVLSLQWFDGLNKWVEVARNEI